ncbi:unnamed protein product [Mytilus coruscus]|uniref:Uncharacterized protein n=1 Tax=Mytilus coruscus TaxID=42192 RepID=A0A6J8F0L1_MYTCO|nr:unnamed protein product [Mytilus coruscus]
MNKIKIYSLDKREVLKSVTGHYTAECSTTILEIVSTIWYNSEDKEVLHIEEIVNTAYERKCFEFLMWIHDNCHPHISINERRLLMSACENDRVDVAKWVLQTFEQKSLDIDGGTLFITTCSKICYLNYNIMTDHHFNYDTSIMEENWKELGYRLNGTVNWILTTFQIQRLDIISGVLKLKC